MQLSTRKEAKTLSRVPSKSGSHEMKSDTSDVLMRHFGVGVFPYDLSIINDNNVKWITYFREEQTSLFLSKIPRYLSRLFGTNEYVVSAFIKGYIEYYEKNAYNRGSANTISKLKDTYGVCLRYSASHSFQPLSFTAVSKDGLPILVDSLIPLLRGSIKDRRSALFLLQLYKLVKVKGKDPDLNSITDEFPVKLNVKGNYLGEFIHQAGQAQGIERNSLSRITTTFRKVVLEMFPMGKVKDRVKDLGSRSRVFNTSKSGPSGPAIASAPLDYIAINHDNILEDITKISNLTRNYELSALLRDQSESPLSYTSENPSMKFPCSARLSVKTEVGAKTRLFAIGDYFTQSALLGFHKYLFEYLQGISEDGTFSHNNVAQIVRAWTGEVPTKENRIYSVDLSKATDRLPALFQREIVSAIMGREFSSHWYSIMTKRPLLTPQKKSVYYAVGQPMGFLSSWAMLAISHHVICRTAFILSKQDKLEGLDYVVIGDDVALRGKEFYKYYLIIMRDILQVPISDSKGFISETELNSNLIPGSSNAVSVSAEIAKRVMVNGEEITPTPPEAVKAGLEFACDFPSLLQSLFDRGVLLEEIGPVPFIASLGFNPRQAVEYSCFPLFPAPPFKVEVGNYFEGRSISPVIQKTVWFSKPGLTLGFYNQIFTKIIRDTLSSAVSSCIESLMLFAQRLPTVIVCGEWQYNSSQLTPFLRIILYNMIADVEEIEIRDAYNFAQTQSFGLKDKINGYHVVNDLNLMLRGKPRDVKDSKLKSAILLSKLIKKVKDLTPFTYESKSVSAETIDLLHLNAIRLPDGEKPEYVSEFGSVMSFLLDSLGNED